jgi:hypothetical protein
VTPTLLFAKKYFQLLSFNSPLSDEHFISPQSLLQAKNCTTFVVLKLEGSSWACWVVMTLQGLSVGLPTATPRFCFKPRNSGENYAALYPNK